jgi:hypothetical protein
MGRCLELLESGVLLGRWLLFVGPERSAGAAFNEERRDYEAPVGTVEQASMLEQLVADLASRLPAAVEACVTGERR